MKIISTEAEEQMVLIDYLEARKLKFTMIPNDTYTTSFKQKLKNKRMGLRKGLPDLLIIANNTLLFIEMKRIKNGIVKPWQQEWIDSLNQCEGVEARVCRGFVEAKKFIDSFKKL